MARVLGRIRLSRETDDTTSPERQRKHIETWAAANDHEVVGWAVDLDVSGSVNPFQAPELGPWLARLDEWDIIVSWKLSRLARKAIPLSALFGYCLDNGKTVVCTHDNIDLSTWVGRLIASVLAHVAEGELEEIQSRAKDSHKYLVGAGRFSGGHVPYGFESYKLPGKGHGIRVCEPQAKVIRKIVDRVFAGESLTSIAHGLNEDGVPTKKGAGEWNSSTLSKMLRSRALIGQSLHKGMLVVDENGVPVPRSEPLIDPDRFAELQTKIDGLRKGPTGRQNGESRLLLDIAFCGSCGMKLYNHEAEYNGKIRRYWRCSGKSSKKTACSEPYVPAERIEEFALAIAISELGDLPMTELVWVPAEGPEPGQLAQVEDAITNIRKERDAGLYDGDDDGYMSRLSALVARRKELAAVASRPAGYERRETGQTWAEALTAADTTAEKRRILLKLEMRLDVSDRGFNTRVTTVLDGVA